MDLKTVVRALCFWVITVLSFPIQPKIFARHTFQSFIARDYLHTSEYPNDDFSHIYGVQNETHVPSILQSICVDRIKDVLCTKSSVDSLGCGYDPSFFSSVEELQNDIVEFESDFGGPFNLSALLIGPRKIVLAAEFKRASPSKGVINLEADVVETCCSYAIGGAKLISVLTESKHFRGSLEDLRKVRISLTQRFGMLRPLLLRKDFIFDRMQILEARANGADTILLMVSILGVNQLKDLIQFSRSYRMEPLVEVTSIQELEIALEAGARVIGVNNRNLHDFSLDLSTTEKCLAHLKSLSPVFGTISIASLSGISTNQEVMKYQALGVNCCLVGEALMKAQDPLQKIKQLLGESESGSDVPLIKICGVTNSDTANTAITSRVNLIGIIFVKSSPRFVSTDEAVKVVQRVRSYGERKERVAWKEILGSIPVNNPKTWFEGTKNLLHQITTRRPLVIGVFQNQPIEQVNSLLETVGFDIIQLHGDEDLDYIKNLNAPVLKTIHIGPNDTESTVVDNIHAAAKLYSGTALALLLDTATKEKSGGTGIKFDWNLLQTIHVPVFVAGGLNVNNIPGLLKFRESLFGLDVNSGVESSPGRKEDFLIRQLMTSLYK